jgi:2-methylcitrate dehydratase PrpD
MQGATRTVAGYAAGLRYEDLPEAAVDALKRSMLDAIGAAIYGLDRHWTRVIRDLLLEDGGKPEATVWGTSSRLPLAQAGFANSVATHAFELDDRRIASYMHPMSAALPAALATGEVLGGLSGGELLASVAAGYEVGLRVGKLVGEKSFLRGFYPPGIGGSFTAAVTAARARRLGEERIAQVLNLTATQAAGLYSPTMVKRFNIGRGTYNGLLAVDLVLAGFGAVDDVMERDFGSFPVAYAGDPDLRLLLEGLGSDFEATKVELKPYVSSRPNHVAIDATLELRQRHPEVTADAIRSIEIEIGTTNYRYGADFAVLDVPGALMSVAYCAAVAFLEGDAFLEQFTQEMVDDPRCRSLLDKTTVLRNQAIDAMGLEARDHTVVRWRLEDGRVLEATRTYAKGHPSLPLSDAEVSRKFHRLADPIVGEERARRIEESVASLPGGGSSDLVDCLRGPLAVEPAPLAG